jgi:hypothetical protein
MRRSSRVVGALSGGIALTLAGIATMAGPTGAATSAKAEYQAALKAAGDQNVHFVSKASESGAQFEVVGDTGKTSGSQVLVLDKGNTVDDFEALVIGSTGYVRGNANALQNILGLTAAQSKTYTNVWLSFPTSNTTLAELVGGLRNKDVSSEIQMTGPYTFGATKTIKGHSTQSIKGFASTSSDTKVPIVLYVETGSTPRPVEEVTNPKGNGSTITGSLIFSKWGEKTHPAVPSHSVSLLSLAPPSG